MKVGFDAKRLFNNFTGLGNYSRFVTSALGAEFPDLELSLYTPRIRKNADTQGFIDNPRFQVRLPESTWHRGLPAWWRSIDLGRVAARDGVGILHGLSNELPWRKPTDIKYVLSVHDLIFLRFPHYYSPLDVRIYHTKLKRSLQLADAIVAISHQTASDLVEFMGVSRERIQVVYQGCHPNFHKAVLPEQREEVRRKYHLPEKYMLCVGTLEKRKNAIQILRALPQVHGTTPVVFVGRATDYQRDLQELVRENKLEKRVQFLHQVAFTDLPAIYQQAEVFLYPSIFEGFGIPILEAIVSRVPVITSHGSCFDEAGGPATVYVNPLNANDLATAMNELLANEAKRQNMIEQSLAYVDRFKPSVIAQNLMQVYQQIATR